MGFFKLGIDFLTCIIHATSKVERNEKNPNSCYEISHPYWTTKQNNTVLAQNSIYGQRAVLEHSNIYSLYRTQKSLNIELLPFISHGVIGQKA